MHAGKSAQLSGVKERCRGRSFSIVAGEVERAVVHVVDDDHRSRRELDTSARPGDAVGPSSVGIPTAVLEARPPLRDEASGSYWSEPFESTSTITCGLTAASLFS